MSRRLSSEDAFYQNMTMGLIRALANTPRISNVGVEKRPPCEKSQITNWEQRHSVYLPDDMKRFYLSTDGFLMTWSYRYAPSDVRRVGCIHIPHLLQISLLRENVEPAPTPQPIPHTTFASTSVSTPASTTEFPQLPKTSASVPALSTPSQPPPPPKDRWGNPTPLITSKTKIFELNNINDVAKVCLIYETTGTMNPKIYLLELERLNWQFLADTFTEYLRMAIAHLGLPYWELCFSNVGLPSWTEQLFLLLAPHLLEDREPRQSRIIDPAPEMPYNVINPNVFRIKPKVTTKQSTHTGKIK